MYRFLLSIKFLILLCFFYACASVNIKTKDNFKHDILLTVAGNPIPAEEFMYVYEKNNFNNDSIYTAGDVKDYLDLFINFKLKVQEAKDEGIDTTKSFLDEFNSYQSELIKPYLLETKETDSLAGKAYERLQYFIHASHILVRITNNDTTEAYNKIKDIYNELKQGKDFGQLAQSVSDDPSAKKNGGDLGYFTAFKMVYPFEKAAYETKVGEMSDIFRTQFGYHILKVHDREPNKGKVKVAHIVVRKDGLDSAKAEDKIFEIADKLETGGDWDYLCKQFSDDEKTRGNGGELNFFDQGQLPIEFKEFENVAFSLENSGDIGGPVETPYGWHLVKLIEKRPPESFDEQKEFIIRQISKGDREQVKEEIVLNRLKKESHFQENKAVFDQLIGKVDSTVFQDKWNPELPDSVMQSTLFEINNKSSTAADFVFFMQNNPRNKSHESPAKYLTGQYHNYIEKELYDFEERRISEQNFDYRMLEKEYFEGLLLFEVMERNVWKKSTEDTVKLKEFYERNKDKYRTGERVKAVIVSTNDAALMPIIKEEIAGDTLEFKKLSYQLDRQTLSVKLTNELKSLSVELLKVPGSFVRIEYDPENVNPEVSELLERELKKNGVGKEKILFIKNKALSLTLNFTLISLSKKALEYKHNLNSTLTVKAEEGIFEKGEKEVLDALRWKVGISEWNDGARSYVVKIDKILGDTTKELREVRGNVISDYQLELEKNWIDDLKSKYLVSVNDDVLNKMIKYFEKK